MNQIEVILNHLEAFLRSIIEGQLSPDGFPSRFRRLLERELVRAMKNDARELPTDASSQPAVIAPNLFTLVLNTVEAQVLLSHPKELDQLTSHLENKAAQAGMAFSLPPLLRVVADPQSSGIKIYTDHTQSGLGESCTYPLDGLTTSLNLPAAEKLPKAFFIINGLSTYSITTPVVNIGSDPENSLKLEDSQISPQHAQLRFIQGNFIIFDLDSRLGTYVNGIPVSSHALQPGDVVQLAHLPLVFGVDDHEIAGQTQQVPAAPPKPEML
jgi:hypothetical protein